MRCVIGCTLLVVLQWLAPTAAEGHHASSAAFDAAQPVRLPGVVVKVAFINPHSWVHIEVSGEDGSKETWEIEGGTPNTLFRRGISDRTLPLGAEVIVD